MDTETHRSTVAALFAGLANLAPKVAAELQEASGLYNKANGTVRDRDGAIGLLIANQASVEQMVSIIEAIMVLRRSGR